MECGTEALCRKAMQPLAAGRLLPLASVPVAMANHNLKAKSICSRISIRRGMKTIGVETAQLPVKKLSPLKNSDAFREASHQIFS